MFMFVAMTMIMIVVMFMLFMMMIMSFLMMVMVMMMLMLLLRRNVSNLRNRINYRVISSFNVTALVHLVFILKERFI
jgi:hypothetical protein